MQIGFLDNLQFTDRPITDERAKDGTTMGPSKRGHY